MRARLRLASARQVFVSWAPWSEDEEEGPLCPEKVIHIYRVGQRMSNLLVHSGRALKQCD